MQVLARTTRISQQTQQAHYTPGQGFPMVFRHPDLPGSRTIIAFPEEKQKLTGSVLLRSVLDSRQLRLRYSVSKLVFRCTFVLTEVEAGFILVTQGRACSSKQPKTQTRRNQSKNDNHRNHQDPSQAT